MKKNIKRKFISTFLLSSIITILNAQTTLYTRADSSDYLDNYYPTENMYSNSEMDAIAWTAGPAFVSRSVFTFNLSSIPANSPVISAYLSLWGDTNTGNRQGDSSLTGSDAWNIERVNSPYYMATVAWNTQPTTTTTDEILMPKSTSIYEIFKNIDVSNIMQDILDNPPNYGLLIRLDTETIYRSMVFCSSQYPDTSERPLLVITYKVACNLSVSIPSVVNVSCNDFSNGSATASITNGTSPFTYSWSLAGGSNATATGLSAGTYTVTVTDSTGCNASTSVTITQPAALSVSASVVANVSCNGLNNGSATAVVGSSGTIITNFLYEPAVQNFPVPASVSTVTITATGAAGGDGYTSDGPEPGGYGVTLEGSCTVIPGHILSIAVGGAGVASTDSGYSGGGGGGGSFIWDSISTSLPLIVAAGGGGGGYIFGDDGGNGSITATPTVGIGDGDGAGGTGSNGGGAGTSDIYDGGGGAGWLSNGGSGGVGDTLSGTGGLDRANGFTGGIGAGEDPGHEGTGGYGGGGGGGWQGGGGGGGYNGGGGGDGAIDAGGGGGGSYLKGTSIGTATATNTGNGSVSISYLSGAGASSYIYSWSNGQTTITATGLSAGTYTVTVSDSCGGSATAAVTITQPSPLTASARVLSNASCSGGTGSAAANLTSFSSVYSQYYFEEAVQHFAVPAGVTTLTVAVAGGQGGNEAGTGSGGGKGESFTGICSVTPGDIISVVVGGMGGTDTIHDGNGGGGGTYLYDSNTITPLVIAGGGGGAGYTGNVGGPGGTDVASPYPATNGTGGNGAGGVGGLGGNAGSSGPAGYAGGAGGAGWSGNGIGGTGTEPTNGGNDQTNGFSGGAGSSVDDNNYGGYGGGGGGGFDAGGGGGGYNGGGGGNDGADAGGGGGGSYLNGTLLAVDSGSVGNGFATLSYGSPGVGGGTPPYTYSWSPTGGTGDTATGLSAGTYTLTVTDNNGCTATASVTITQPLSINVSVNVINNITCNGASNGSASATVSGGIGPYQYTWYPSGGNSSLASGLSAGVYYVMVTDSSGCTATASGTITQPSSLGVYAGTTSNIVCTGNNGSAYAYINGGTSPYTYLWSDANSQTTAYATGLSAGTYTVTVSDSCGATATSSTIILPPALLTILINTTTTTCAYLSNGTATAIPQGGSAPYAYLWNDADSQATATATGLSVGTYTVIVSDSCGNSNTASAVVSPPLPLTVTTNLITNSCNGTSSGSAVAIVNGGTEPYSYLWNDGNSQTTVVATGLSAGNYTVTVTDSCGSVSTASVTINQSAIIISIASVTIVECQQYGVIVATPAQGGASPYTYQWSPAGGTDLTASNLSAGTYTVTVTDNNGCEATASESVTLPPLLSVTANVTDTISCFGGSNGSVTASAFGGSLPYTFSWFPSGGSGTAEAGIPAATYIITVTDSNGCIATASTILSQPPGMIITHDSVNVTQSGACNGMAGVTVVSGDVPPYTYLWVTDGQTNDTIQNQCEGIYCCVITAGNGCSQTTCVTVGISTGIADINNSSNITIYPDPNNGSFTVTGVSRGQIIELYNYLGQEIVSRMADDNPTIRFDISTKANGIYLLRIESKDGNTVTEKKIIKTQ